MSEKEKLEELEESKEFKEYKEKQAELSEKRIDMITKMVKQHFSALTLSGKLNAIEMFQIGMDTILAGYGIVSRYSDMMNESMSERKDVIMRTKLAVDDVLSKTLLNDEVIQQQVANTAMHNLKANKLIKK